MVSICAARKALLAVSVSLILMACGGGGGGTSGDDPPIGGLNKDTTTWGHYRGPIDSEWYISDSKIMYNSGWSYAIQSATSSGFVARFEGTIGPPPDKFTITLTRLGDSAYTCSPITGSSGQVTDKPFAIAKIVGTEAKASGTAMQEANSRGLMPAAGISLVIINALNSLDAHREQTDENGDFSTEMLIPGDSYEIIPSTGGSMGTVTVPENDADLGLVSKPVGTFAIACELENASIDEINALSYTYLGELTLISARVTFSGTGSTGWATWNFTRDGVAIPKNMSGTNATADYFSLPTDGGYLSDTIDARLPVDFVTESDFAPGADHVDIPLGVKGVYGTTFSWEDRVMIRYYKASFLFGTDGSSNMEQTATLICPDLRVHSLTLLNYPANCRVPLMKGRYYLIIMGKGSYRLGPNVTFPTGDVTPVADDIETTADEPNYSRSLAKELIFGKTYEGVVGPLDTYGYNLDPVDYLYFDID